VSSPSSASDTIAGLNTFVTGGGSGIGLATALLFVAEGAHVTICGRTEAKLVDAVAQLQAAATGDATVHHAVADITDESQLAAATDAAAAVTGSLDVVVANAGGSSHVGSIVDCDADAVRATIDQNLMGTILTIKHAARHMVAQGHGSIVAVSSGAGAFPHRHLWSYGAAKAGLDHVVRHAAEELGEHGVRVNSVQPGIVDDELMTFITGGGALLRDYLAEMPLGRLGQVDDIAKLIRFLSGPESSWITGDTIAIDGGHHLRRGANYQLLFDA
jgi:NAD(P)-dependent dehydrogenase (short-subunit alcohol dehydrogenase family)